MGIQGKNINVARSLRLLETMKSSLLSDVAGLYEDMVKMNLGNQVEISDRFSDIILTSYLLGKQLGVSYNVVEKRLEKKIRLCLLEERAGSMFSAELSELAEHFKIRECP